MYKKTFSNTNLNGNIKKEVENILSAYWLDTTPIDINKIIEKMKITITIDTLIPMDVMIDINNRKKPVIILKLEKSNNLSRFLLAHALGHYVLCHGKFFEDNLNDVFNEDMLVENYLDINKEKESSLFASNILMPDKSIKYFIYKNNMPLKTLANYFNVPILLAENRVKAFLSENKQYNSYFDV